METRRGGCNCGAVRLQAEGPPLRTGLCHCLTCRKATGSVFNAYAIWPRGQVVVTGETRHWENRHFCPGCGSSIFGLSEEGDEIGSSWAASMPGRGTWPRAMNSGSSGGSSG